MLSQSPHYWGPTAYMLFSCLRVTALAEPLLKLMPPHSANSLNKNRSTSLVSISHPTVSKDPAALISPASPQTLIAYRQLEIVGTQSLSCTQAGAIQSYECILLTPVTWTTPFSLDSKPQEPIGIHRDSKQYKGLYRRLREQIHKDDLTYKRKSRNTSNSIDYCLITELIPEGQVPCISNTLTHRNQGVCVYVCVSCFNRPLGKMT